MTTPRRIAPAYLWFLVWTTGMPHPFIVGHIGGYTRKEVLWESSGGSIAEWRRMYRRGARVVRCKVTVAE